MIKLLKKALTGRVILSVSVACLLVGVLGYMTWTKTPGYSLKMVSHAIEEHDLLTFEKYVDTETLIARFIDQLLEDHLSEQEANDTTSEWSLNFQQGLVHTMKPQLVSTWEQQIKSFVEQGSGAQNNQLQGETAVNISALFGEDEDSRLDFAGIENVKREGNISIVTLAFVQPRTNDELKLDVKMRKMEGFWQVAELPHAVAFVDEVNGIYEKLLSEKNQPIVGEIANALVVQDAKKYERSDAWGIEQNAVFDITLKNVGQRDIKSLKGLIVSKDLLGKSINTTRFDDDQGISVGAEVMRTWSVDTNPFIAEEALLYETTNEQLQIEVVIQQVIFEDGSELMLFEKI